MILSLPVWKFLFNILPDDCQVDSLGKTGQKPFAE